MFCPQCRSEYVEGVTECRQCGVSLVAALREEPPRPDLEPVTAYEACDAVGLNLACSMLDDAGIAYFVQHERIQDLFGGGRLGGFNLIAGPMLVQVASTDLEAAREVLKNLELQEPVEGEEPP